MYITGLFETESHKGNEVRGFSGTKVRGILIAIFGNFIDSSPNWVILSSGEVMKLRERLSLSGGIDGVFGILEF
jgi:hypothetical protein